MLRYGCGCVGIDSVREGSDASVASVRPGDEQMMVMGQIEIEGEVRWKVEERRGEQARKVGMKCPASRDGREGD